MSDVVKNLPDELRALVLPTGVTSIARADLFEDAAQEIERLREFFGKYQRIQRVLFEFKEALEHSHR